MLEAQRFWADSLATEFQAIATYNNALSGWEYAKGSILDYAHIRFADKPPADAEAVRAADYERNRTRQLVRRADAKSVDLYPRDSEEQEDSSEGMSTAAPTLPCLWKLHPPLGAVENLPTMQGSRSEK